MRSRDQIILGALALVVILLVAVVMLLIRQQSINAAQVQTLQTMLSTEQTTRSTLSPTPPTGSIQPTDTPSPGPPDTAVPSATPVPRSPKALNEIPITFPIQSSEVADYFNQIARQDDIALLLSARLFMLPSINAGRVRVGFASWAEAEQQLDGLIDQIDFVTYNPEHWAQTPEEERSNLVATVERAAEFAHSRNMQLMVSPDRRFARESLGEIAKHADLIGLQGQRLQDDPAVFEAWARELIQIARASNPDVLIFVQVGATQGTASEMMTAIRTIEGEIDGISIWSAPSTLPILMEFISLLRQ